MQVPDSDSDQLKIGERVKQARESVGFDTQPPFARALGVHIQSVSNWETGHTAVTRQRARQIEHLCNADAGFILMGEGYLHGGDPNFNPPSAIELDLRKRVADLERELAVLRQSIAVARQESAAALAQARKGQPGIEPPQPDIA